mmetsp:Transcript_19386/g.68626  ORF Transcript_19386/g.68626 Transcript_19386/m.68626 type:complete len:269 (-) Transcript_19386:307-1113(-)
MAVLLARQATLWPIDGQPTSIDHGGSLLDVQWRDRDGDGPRTLVTEAIQADNGEVARKGVGSVKRAGRRDTGASTGAACLPVHLWRPSVDTRGAVVATCTATGPAAAARTTCRRRPRREFDAVTRTPYRTGTTTITGNANPFDDISVWGAGASTGSTTVDRSVDAGCAAAGCCCGRSASCLVRTCRRRQSSVCSTSSARPRPVTRFCAATGACIRNAESQSPRTTASRRTVLLVSTVRLAFGATDSVPHGTKPNAVDGAVDVVLERRS